LATEYETLGTIGSGAHGKVKKVKHIKTGKLYAIKKILISECNPREDIIKEIEILKKLDHPNIVRVYEFSQNAKYFILLTEYCAGGDLISKVINMKQFTEHKAAIYMKQLLSAVSYCHSHSIAHRDLKPDNIALDNESDDSILKVIDFGSSKAFRRDDKMKDIQGTVLIFILILNS